MKKAIFITGGIVIALVVLFFGLKRFYRQQQFHLETPFYAEDGEVIDVVVDITWRRQIKGFKIQRRVFEGSITIGDQIFYHVETLYPHDGEWASMFSTALMRPGSVDLRFYSYTGEDGETYYYISKDLGKPGPNGFYNKNYYSR
ncbi:MAG: hypothetical protein K2N94_03185 [Lachnospiraceae bacterium]|nr:hypothetical protein [Lachnospiraceae bacterium]